MKDTLAMRETLITLTSDIVAAHVGNNSVTVSDLPTLISNVYHALAGLEKPEFVEVSNPEPAVSIRSSLKYDYIVCLEDGKKLKMLKRHLASSYNMTPDQYRARWNLPADYPMVAPGYAKRRSELAKSIGLGRKPEKKIASTPAKRSRKTAAVEA
ncbi:MucR family transcriptional regulator [Novosphingobium taihuense]|uniref:MucR family transcriptional regulator n=1 Tax=Novosphingobium taihuense TaxID=260085 RepID=UPI00119FFCF7|nr:MucR family transcriptional regulator [Novosphingobium taihuense]